MKNALKRVRPLAQTPTNTTPEIAGLPSAAVASPAIPDPLRLAIANYHYGVALFECASEADWAKAGGEDAVISATWGAPFEVLEEWDKPATTLDGAIDAMTLVLREAEFHASSPIIQPLADAVLQYLKNSKVKS